MTKENLITDERLFPRSEYYSRFQGTTAFKMDNPEYWGTYHRSESTRFFSKAGGRKNTQFISPCTKKPAKANSFSAHTGGIVSPFALETYRGVIRLSDQATERKINARDTLLLYKRKIAQLVVASFEDSSTNSQQMKKRDKESLRPIVFEENGYPCVLIKLPALNTVETQTESAAYWAKHPKPFQRLVLASFIALLNTNAVKEGIPIEMVIRSSFGHNLPSVCETDNTFRINVGLVPEAYAQLIGKTLSQLNDTISQLMETPTLELRFTSDFRKNVRQYNAKHLKKAIDSKALYTKLRNTRDYNNAANSDASFKRLYESFFAINKAKKEGAKYSNFVPVTLAKEKVWEIIHQRGDSLGKSVLAECFRKNETVDWFANVVMEELTAGKDSAAAIEAAVKRLLTHLRYQDSVTLDYSSIHKDLNKKKGQFVDLSFKKIYKNDPDFDEVSRLLFQAFDAERPDKAFYAELERAGVDFYAKYRASETIDDEIDVYDEGSESSFSEDLSLLSEAEDEEESENESDSSQEASDCSESEQEEEGESLHFSHSKLRLCSGMKAIVLAHYGALSYLKKNNIKSYCKDINQMYYEVEDALRMVNVDIKENKVRTELKNALLHFDLNHCNAANEKNITLAEKLTAVNPAFVVLDYTSSTNAEIKRAIQQCLARTEVKFIFLVESGLKNSQGGQDFNPYGEVRVIARDKKSRKEMIKLMRNGLAEEDALSQEVHEMVRTSKRRGLATSLLGFFAHQTKRFQAVDEAKFEVSPSA